MSNILGKEPMQKPAKRSVGTAINANRMFLNSIYQGLGSSHVSASVVVGMGAYVTGGATYGARVEVLVVVFHFIVVVVGVVDSNAPKSAGGAGVVKEALGSFWSVGRVVAGGGGVVSIWRVIGAGVGAACCNGLSILSSVTPGPQELGIPPPAPKQNLPSDAEAPLAPTREMRFTPESEVSTTLNCCAGAWLQAAREKDTKAASHVIHLLV